MPEGPEIRLAADRIGAALEGHVVRKIGFAFDRLKRWESRIAGARVKTVRARGKALLIDFGRGHHLYSHNQLYGRWYVTAPERPPATRRSLRVELHTAPASAWLYSASEIEVLDDEGVATHPYLARLGPDPLDRRLRPATVSKRLDQRRFAGRSLAALLLDQSFLCGVGNYLRSEILFVARVDGRRRAQDLEPEERMRLARAALRIARRSYRTRGVTADPAIVKRLRSRGASRSAYRHFVFGRDGEPCHRCGHDVVRLELAGRRLYACERCQR